MNIQMPSEGRQSPRDQIRGDKEVLSDDNSHQKNRNSHDSTALSESEIFDVLRNSRRRSIISYLLENDRQATVNEITGHVTKLEYELNGAEPSSDERRRVYSGLYQCHLPRLEKYDVINFNKAENTVSLSANADRVETYLQKNNERNDIRAELGFAVGTALIVLLGVIGIGPLNAVPMISWTIITGSALIGLALLRLNKTIQILEMF